VGDGEHPSALVAFGVVEDGELGRVATGDAGLLSQRAGDGVRQAFTLVQEGAR
jgi:hypothetical protein